METDLGYMNDDTSKIEEEPQYFNPPVDYMPPHTPPVQEKTDIFATIDKSTWIIGFAVFLLGFFMGKTMQPVILRYA